MTEVPDWSSSDGICTTGSAMESLGNTFSMKNKIIYVIKVTLHSLQLFKMALAHDTLLEFLNNTLAKTAKL